MQFKKMKTIFFDIWMLSKCVFVMVIRNGVQAEDQCKDYTLDAPRNGQKLCSPSETGYTCDLTCDPGYFFYSNSGTTPKTMTCSAGEEWVPSRTPDCVEPTRAEFFAGFNIIFQTSTGVNIPEGCDLLYYQTTIENSLENVAAPAFTAACNETFGDPDSSQEINRKDGALQAVSNGDQLNVTAKFKVGPDEMEDVGDLTCGELIYIALFGGNVSTEALNVIPASGSCPQLGLVKEAASQIQSNFECDDDKVLYIEQNENACLPCPYGTYHDGTTCHDCPRGQYQDQVSKDNVFITSCKSCPEGKNTLKTGSNEASDCVGKCPAGTYSPSGLEECSQCPVNTYQENVGAISCVECLDDKITLAEGSTSKTHCMVKTTTTSTTLPTTSTTTLTTTTKLSTSETAPKSTKSTSTTPTTTITTIKTTKKTSTIFSFNTSSTITPTTNVEGSVPPTVTQAIDGKKASKNSASLVIPIGGAVGGLLVLAIIVIIALVLRRRFFRSTDRPTTPPTDQQPEASYQSLATSNNHPGLVVSEYSQLQDLNSNKTADTNIIPLGADTYITPLGADTYITQLGADTYLTTDTGLESKERDYDYVANAHNGEEDGRTDRNSTDNHQPDQTYAEIPKSFMG